MPVSKKPTRLPHDNGDRPSAIEGLDHADPHAAEEGDPYNTRHSGGEPGLSKDIGPNPAKHNGAPPRRPDNASTKGTP